MVKKEKSNIKKYRPWISLAIIIAIIIFLVNIDRVLDLELPTPDQIEDKISNIPMAGIEDYVNNPDGILIEEYSDYQCPACRGSYPYLKQILLRNSGKINFVHRHMPLSYHSYAQKAAEASECAKDQDKFFEYSDKLYIANSLEVKDLKRYAAEFGLDTEQFNACLDGDEKRQLVLNELQHAIDIGVSGTPTFFVEGEMVFLDEIEGRIMAHEKN